MLLILSYGVALQLLAMLLSDVRRAELFIGTAMMNARHSLLLKITDGRTRPTHAGEFATTIAHSAAPSCS